MDIRDILKSFDSLSEAKTTTDKGVTTHKGDYGREFDTDEEGNAVVKKVKSTEPKPKGRRPDPDRPKLGKDDPKNKKVGDLFGRTTGAVPKGKKGTAILGKAQSHPDNKNDDGTGDEEPTSKKSLKEYFDQMDQALVEAGAIEIKPASQMPKQPGQTSQPAQPGQQQQVAGQPQKNTQVIAQGGKTLGTVDDLQLANQIKQSIGQGKMTLNPQQQMEEDGENWIKGAIKHPGAFTKKASSHGMTPKEFANKVLAHKKDYPAKTEKQAQLAKTLGKMHEEDSSDVFSKARNDKRNADDEMWAASKFGNKQAAADVFSKARNDKRNADDEMWAARQGVKEAEAPPHFAQSSPLSMAEDKSDAASDYREALATQIYDLSMLIHNSDRMYASDSPQDNAKLKRLQALWAQYYPGQDAVKIGSALSKSQQRPQQSQQAAPKPQGIMQKAKNAISGMFEGSVTKKKPDADKDGVPDWADKKPGKDDNKGKKKGAAPKKGVNPFAKKDEKKKVKEGKEQHLQAARLEGKSHALRKMPYNCTHDDMEESRCYHDGFKEGLDECYGQMPILGRTAVGEMGQGPEVSTMASYGADDMGMDEGTAFTAGLAKTPHGGKFNVGGSTFTDRTSYDSNLDEFAFEALDKQLNAILEGKEVSEGMTVSISKGQQGSPDSVSVSAQDGEADQLLSIIKSAGMGLFGGDEQNGYGAPQGSAGAHGGISVVDDHDGMMALMKKLSGGGEMVGAGDYESEEGHGDEGHMHGDEETCNECGGMMEENHQCGSGQQVVDEVESEDQMEFEVAENAPDSGADNTDADVADQVGSDEALATADAAQDMATAKTYSSPTEGKEDTTGEEAGKEKVDEGDNCKKCDCNPCKCETVAESFANLYKKLAFLSEESTEKEDEKAEKAGKKVANDIEYDEGHKGKDDNNAEKAGKKVTKDIEYDDKKDEKYKKDKKVDESYANSADDTFEADIGFMMNVISGGLNKQKSTGQTTVPVISGQKSRMGVDGLGNPLKESTDLLRDYRKLSGL
jgi:hypothetical protein